MEGLDLVNRTISRYDPETNTREIFHKRVTIGGSPFIGRNIGRLMYKMCRHAQREELNEDSLVALYKHLAKRKLKRIIENCTDFGKINKAKKLWNALNGINSIEALMESAPEDIGLMRLILAMTRNNLRMFSDAGIKGQKSGVRSPESE